MLKKRLYYLENRLAGLSEYRLYLEKQHESFRNTYLRRFGSLLRRISNAIPANAHEPSTKHEPENSAPPSSAEESRSGSSSGFGDHDIKASPLSGAERDQVKAAYKRAARLCHPDVVDPSLAAQAGEIFGQLSRAYKADDLKGVLEILNDLLAGRLSPPSLTGEAEVTRLLSTIRRVESTIRDEEATIRNLEATDDFDVISRYGDRLDEFFASEESRLKEQLRSVESTQGLGT